MPESLLTASDIDDDGELEIHCPVCDRLGALEVRDGELRLSDGFAFSDTRVPRCLSCDHIAGWHVTF